VKSLVAKRESKPDVAFEISCTLAEVLSNSLKKGNRLMEEGYQSPDHLNPDDGASGRGNTL
jgi:hypothetical protein